MQKKSQMPPFHVNVHKAWANKTVAITTVMIRIISDRGFRFCRASSRKDSLAVFELPSKYTTLSMGEMHSRLRFPVKRRAAAGSPG